MFVACLVLLSASHKKSAHRYRMNVGTSSIQNEIDNVLLLHVLIRIGVLLWLLLSATIWFYITHTCTHARPFIHITYECVYAFFPQAISSFRYPAPNLVSWYRVVLYQHFPIFPFFLFFYSLFIDIFLPFRYCSFNFTSFVCVSYQQTHNTRKQNEQKGKATTTIIKNNSKKKPAATASLQ